MLHFKKLRLSGFKSFVEPTTLEIDAGLTGVVGPNGCGKSNLVEALKWVMGETSAKQMRGGEMDDVIFSGTDRRPPRNVAEVVLTLDNALKGAPSQFSEADDLEIARRIEREKGSLYKINGADVRARDVQLLFADQATGSRSTALVSQGKIGAVISAKPTERRLLLEEAAGIRGLHSRRHEAELRLKGAETNLERLDDILVTLEAQMNGLKKQARQATRYRNLSDLIRTAEATLFYLRWTTAESELEQYRMRLSEVEAEVNRLGVIVGEAGTEQAEAAADIPALRDTEAAAAAALQRLMIARDGLDEEEKRIEAQANDTRSRIEETIADTTREQSLISDAEAAHARLAEEQSGIEAAREGEEQNRAKAQEDLSTAGEAVQAHENELSGLTQRVADSEARRGSLERRREELTQRQTRLAGRLEELRSEHARLEADAPEAEAMADAEADMTRTQSAVEDARAMLEEAEESHKAAEGERERLRGILNEARDAATKLQAEREALTKLLDTGDPDMFPPLIDAVTVEPGFEVALGTALGDEIEAPIDEAAAIHWRALPPMTDAPALPAGATPLSQWVQAPPALARRLSQIGVVDSVDAARNLIHNLRPGQRLVTRDGALVRWDGYTVGSGATTSAARRLEQRNRLREVEGQATGANQRLSEADANFERARETVEARNQAVQTAREGLRNAENTLGEARDILAQIKEKMAAHGSKLAAVGDQITGVEGDLAEVTGQLEEAVQEIAQLPDIDGDRARIETLREELNERRSHLMECRARHDEIERMARERSQRLEAIARETQSWSDRKQSSATRLEELTARRAELEAVREELAQKPAALNEKRQALLSEIETAEQNRRDAADKLQTAETRLAEADKRLRTVEADMARARENRVRAEGSVEQALQTCHSIAERVDDRLECRPDQLFEIAGLDPEKPLPDLEQTERKVERLQRERETMGPVNLRAEQEMRELEEQIETLNVEREDLIKAIDKLRRGISELNREGRQRLLQSFEEVNEHFQELFQKLFGGGHAHLELTEADDPLDAGLEIMASPPGKKLQNLTLLSGGEQALTALSLLFAVFLTNPSPICVLDEVDAPLDDANVDRFCSMLEHMSKQESTRFLVITHHRMTMARMDRLYGVTMSERGVSQLVSVDLQKAEEIRESA
ncbi:MAG: chromosome segregation protein SMC [Rhodospirillales bacterium]|nr:chromosome segregation protein SMC [Rhodospirillales bacterium]